MGKNIVFGAIIILLIGFIGYKFMSSKAVNVDNHSAEITNITTAGLTEKLANSDDNTVFIDVREPDEYASGHIEGFINLPLSILNEETADFPKDAEIVIICRSGNRSMQAAQKLLDYGFENPINVKGGIMDWDGELVK
jgi:rhodanese-related sulfurtransferase